MDTFIHRDYCRAKRGKKVIDKVAGKRYKRIGIVAAKLSSRIDLSENSVMPIWCGNFLQDKEQKTPRTFRYSRLFVAQYCEKLTAKAALRSFRTGLIIEPLQYEGTMDSGLFERGLKKDFCLHSPPTAPLLWTGLLFTGRAGLFRLQKSLDTELYFSHLTARSLTTSNPFGLG